MKHKTVCQRILLGALVGVLVLCGTGSTCLAEGFYEGDRAAVTALLEDVTVTSRFGELLFGRDRRTAPKKDPAPTSDERRLYPGGEVFGIRLRSTQVTVAETDGTAGGLAVGDVILAIDGTSVTQASDVPRLVAAASGTLCVTVERCGVKKTLTLTPERADDGSYRLGITVRDGTAGIGTVTFIDPATGAFGGLGHGICDAESGEVIPMRDGAVTEVTLGGVKRGEVGKPGELHGVLRSRTTGVLYTNSDCGVFGHFDTLPTGKEALPIATRDEVKAGAATILSTVHGGEPCSYEVTIGDIDYQSDGTKSFTVKVTDPALIAMTGGIVRGMSGSPIIQNGKLVGAVTHVMVADPTEGYGIFIENMLNASEVALPKAA